MGQGVRQCVVVVEHGAAVVSILGRLHVGGGASRDLESLWGFYQSVHLWHCCQLQKFSENLIILNLLTY